MTVKFCPECGTENDGSAFCANCGANLREESPQGQDAFMGEPPQQPSQGYSAPNYQNQGQQNPGYPNQGYGQPAYGQQNQGRWGKPPDYIRPENYQFTTGIVQRIIGTLRFDVHVVEEIEDRPELKNEAVALLLVNFFIIAVLRTIMLLYFPNDFTVYSVVGSVVEIFLDTFLVGFAFLLMIAKVGGAIGGHETQTDTEEILRVLSYAYVARSIEIIFDFISEIYGGLTIVIWFILFVYQAILFLFVVRRALDKGYGTALVTVIVAFIGRAIALFILYIVTESIFGPTYY